MSRSRSLSDFSGPFDSVKTSLVTYSGFCAVEERLAANMEDCRGVGGYASAMDATETRHDCASDCIKNDGEDDSSF